MKQIKLVSLLSLVIAFLWSCQKEEKTALTSGVMLENMNTSVNPGDDFTKYVNGTWMEKTAIPADKSRYGAFDILRDNSEENVKKIIEESAAGTFEKGSNEQKVGDLYKSYTNMDKRNEIGTAPLVEELAKIETITNYDDLATYFAYANKVGYAVPLSIFVYQDFKDPTIYTVYAWQGGIGLPEREYYLAQDARSKEIREKYVAHVAKMFDLAGLKNGQKASETIMALETTIAEQHMKKEDTRNIQKLYNMFSVSALPEIMPDFNWGNFMKEAGLEKQDKLGIGMLDYTKALNDIIKATPIATWKTYLQWGLINGTASRLTEAMDKQNFEFYSKELRGVEEQRPLWRRGVATVNSVLGEVVGKVYVEHYFPPEAKERMEGLVGNLLKAYEESIKELDWMSDSTKVQALDKLSKFTPKIGYPNKWKDYSKLDIDAEDLFGNLKRSSIVEYNRQIDRLGGPIDKELWGMTPQTVNAYYNPTLNEIVFPAAILQPPFFDMNADDAINYGAIGAVIGHEIGHGFDDQGSTFDGDGMLRNWWTDADKEEFKKRTGALVEQYNQFEVLDSVYVNGAFTLGENIGDLGGLSIGLKAYKMSLEGEEGPVMDGFTAEQRVFIGYGQAFLGKYRDEALRVQVKTDPHSPGYFRVNGAVRNVPEFYTAFDVKPENKLYLSPEERVKIW
ncbi:M13 family metallopeptidase [Leptobacterium sp. I13]|uniref:M13 family metallopeptidase n=1 Tax=Leptobacterium meishanense TaxID=3128904 RepID=UPI0030EC7CE8